MGCGVDSFTFWNDLRFLNCKNLRKDKEKEISIPHNNWFHKNIPTDKVTSKKTKKNKPDRVFSL